MSHPDEEPDPMTVPELDRVTTIIEQVAREELLPRFGALRHDDVREKSPGDLVTVADHAAEARLTRALGELLPGSVVVGEEAAAERPETLELLRGAAPVWVIDPLDGTANFVAGRQRFAIIVALVMAGVTEAAWIHRPVDGATAAARRGHGAHIAGTPLSVSGAKPLAACDAIATDPTYPSYHRHGLSRLEGRFRTLAPCGSAGLDYMDLACGALDVAVYTWQKPWDHAAGVLLHAEAGGTGGRVDGTPYRATDRVGAPLVLAPDRRLFDQLADLLREEGPHSA
jgi:fructose-1,6-bisphosphatase/inositol monophosphatase family enzyme